MKIKHYQFRNISIKLDKKTNKKNHAGKIQLTIAINFMSFKNSKEDCVMHWESDNIELMISGKEDEVIELFQSFYSRYQIALGWKLQCRVVIWSLIVLICCNINVINLMLWIVYIDSSDWIKKQKRNNKSNQ